MSAGLTSSPTEQLADFLTAVSVAGDEESAIRVAIERACGAFGAQIGAISDGAEALSAIAPDRSAVDPASAERLAKATGGPLEIPELGELEVLVAPIEDQRLDRLILGRSGARGFSAEESALARGMARAIAMAVRLHRVVDAERRLRKLSEGQAEENSRLIESLAERQRLLERLSKIQASIVRRHELGEVLEAIVAGAQELLGDETVGLRLIDPEDPEQLILVASAGLGEELIGDRRTRVGTGAGGRAVEQGEPVVIEDYAADDHALAPFVADGIMAAMATPVREHGEIAGSLVVATRRRGRTYSRVEREMLVALAEHASLALTDARTVEDAVHQAFHDSLTGLPNRLLLMDRLEHSLARASRLGSRVAVLFVDLDDFKNVNDSLGHVAGDEVLRDASARLLGCLRNSDTAARFGGDEFVVLLEEVDESNVAHAANRILEALDDPFEIQGREILIGASIGIAVGSDDADDLLRNADLALYRAKAKGKGQQQVFEPEMHVAVVERMELEGALAKALREAELVLHYQPVLDLASRRLTGVEALVRWQHPTRGLLLPSEFVPVAEDSRLMAPLGRWVLETACEQTRAWRERHPELELMLCANLSSAQFNDSALVEQVRDALAGTGLRADRLVLELTETALMREPEMVAEYMAELKRLGVRLAIDDFGTGNASLRHLARFPVDVLKVDRSFVRRIGIDHRQTAIADSIIGLGQELEMTVVAEGIETADQLAQLIALGCGYGQGYYLARPAPAEEIGSLLDRMAAVRTESQAGGHSARVAAG
jgi:diguanylate cyclase (GGDEF)-like protein